MMKCTKFLCVGLLTPACLFSACNTQSIAESVEADDMLGNVIIHGNQVYDYSSVKATMDNAVVVVKGTVSNLTASKFRSDRIFPYGTAEVNVQETYKGDPEEKHIKFSFAGGEISAANYKEKLLDGGKVSPEYITATKMGGVFIDNFSESELRRKSVNVVLTEAPQLENEENYVLMLQREDNGEYTLIASNFSVLTVDEQVAQDFEKKTYDLVSTFGDESFNVSSVSPDINSYDTSSVDAISDTTSADETTSVESSADENSANTNSADTNMQT